MNNLIIIGAQRCGTSYCYQVLQSHPEIFMAEPMRPEPKYFIKKTVSEQSVEDYQLSLFPRKNLQSYKVFGEKSTGYIEYPEVAERIKSILPKVKILVLLRNPVQRAISNFFFSKLNGLEKRSIHDAFILNKPVTDVDYSWVAANPFHYVERSEYLRYINYYTPHFEKNQLKIMVQEEILSHPEEHFSSLFTWLGVDSTHKTDLFEKMVNPAPRSEIVSKQIIDKLQDHFVSWNKRLQQEFEIDLKYWNDKV